MINQKVLRDISFDIYNNPRGDSIIAGGAPRDVDLGVPPKDVDVFVEVANQQEEDDYLSFMRDDMGYERLGREEGEEYDRALNHIQSVWNYQVASHIDYEIDQLVNIPVQFIFLKRNEMPVLDHIVKRVVNLFDINVCRIALWYDGDSDKTKIYKGAYYKQGVLDRSVHETDTFYRNLDLSEQSKDNTRRRIQRISRKLGWKASYGHSSDVGGRQTWDYRPNADDAARFEEAYRLGLNNQANQARAINNGVGQWQYARPIGQPVAAINAPIQWNGDWWMPR